MPSFTITNPAVQTEGLILGMRLTAATMTPPPGQQQQFINVRAMIDTGATLTAIRDDIPSTLGLNPVGYVLITTPTSAGVPCYQYLVNLAFPNNTHVTNVTVTAVPLQGQNVSCLVGRDILGQAVLVYNGYMNQFTLSF